MRYYLCFFVLAFLIYPQTLLAGASVVGCAESTGLLATPTEVSEAATSTKMSVQKTLKNVGRSLKGSQNKIAASINKNFEVQNAAIRKILVSLAESREKMIHTRMFGPQSKAYGMETGKSLDKVMAGKKGEDNLVEKFRDEINQRTRLFKKREQRKRYYKAENVASISPSFFFPRNSVRTAEQTKKALFAVKTVIDPFPTPQLPDRYKEKGRDMGYRAKRKVKYSRLAMPIAVASDIVSSYAPTMELGDWAEKIYRKMGGEGQPSQVVDGKISPMGYIDLMVNSRFANQEWYSGRKGIHGKTKTGVLRELAIMKSVSMEMQRRQMKYMQQTAGLLAQDQAVKTDERFNKPLNRLYRKVVK